MNSQFDVIWCLNLLYLNVSVVCFDLCATVAPLKESAASCSSNIDFIYFF